MKNISYEKMSKKAKKEYNALKRNTWGELNPTTRKPINPKVYNRKKPQKWSDESNSVVFDFIYNLSSLFFYSVIK
ncbi:MAG: hypothetical protein R3Y35_11165 [Clostridia bacterium]